MSKFRKVGIREEGKIVPFGSRTQSWLYFDGKTVSFTPTGSDPWYCTEGFNELISRGTFAYADEITDTERLEWMIENQVTVRSVGFKEGITSFWIQNTEGVLLEQTQECFTARESIDDAMRRRDE